ncbi:MAG: hypothetical protein M2R45_05334 [Verrucomicrobia subdivision 3 bacterium]|nr:hypothetical protein [Limisphaerales bacterium]MCS1414947.1 hypothetical protein [Limisphaerales bacterium]
MALKGQADSELVKELLDRYGPKEVRELQAAEDWQ